MPSTYTSRLRLTLPATGELTNVWGNTVNNGITELVDAAIAGSATLSTWGGAGVAYTLSNNNGAADEARCMFLVASGTPGENKNIICPAITKLYVVRNNVSGGFSVTLKTSAGTGITVPNGTTMFLRCDGTNVVDALTRVDNFQAATLGVSGNLTFSGTAQRILGDFSNATVANRVYAQTSTTNGVTNIGALPNGTATQAGWSAWNNSDPTNAAFIALQAVGSTETRLNSAITGTGTYLPMTFYTGGSERVRVDTSGNVGIGTTSTGTAGLSLNQTLNLSWEQSATESVANLFRQTSSAALVMSVGYKRSATANGFASSFGSSFAKTAISLGTTAGAITFYTDTAATTAVGTDVTPTERMRIDSSGNVGVGTASPGAVLHTVRTSAGAATVGAFLQNSDNTTSTEVRLAFAANNAPLTSDRYGWIGYVNIGGTNGGALTFATTPGGQAATEQFRITSTGGITSANLADAVGYKGTPLNEQSTAYTLVIGDQGKSIVHPASDNNARTFTIPANGSVAYPVGTTITFINMINTLTISINTDTMYLAGAGTTGSRTLAAYGMATAVKMTSTTWIISGNGLS